MKSLTIALTFLLQSLAEASSGPYYSVTDRTKETKSENIDHPGLKTIENDESGFAEG